MKTKLLILIFLMPLSAYAGLGDQQGQVERDRAALDGVNRGVVKTQSQYQVIELNSHGNTIHEYVDSSGRVFAVAWQGIKEPDLSVLLGSYYNEYDAAREAHGNIPGRTARALDTPRLQVRKGGHMRDLRGRAIALDIAPQNLNFGDVK